MTFVSALLDEYIIRCSIVGGCINSSLDGLIGLTLAHNGIEAIHLGNRLALSVLLGVNLSVSYAIKEEFQVGVSTSAELRTIAGVIGV